MKKNTKKFKQLIVTSVSAFVLASVCSQVNAADWGATALSERYRPQRSWVNGFSETPDIIATGLISDAIDSCDAIVGWRQYCVVDVSNAVSGFPLTISRSKTKIMGSVEMDPLTSNHDGAFITIGDNTQRVMISGLDIQGHYVADDEIYGIIIRGKNIQKIMINDNTIHDFNSDSNAHGIAVYGTGRNNRNGIKHIVIEGNEVYSMKTGSSESIVVNGNVRRWEIIGNDVYDVNNIAIDAIGGEGTSPTRTTRRGRRVLPGRLDSARFGFIEDNYVDSVSTLNNPAYGNEESWAAAIYVDGAHHIKIANNVVTNAPWSYEVGSENCLISRQITLTGNSATDSFYGDLLLGGYAETGYKADTDINCDPLNTSDENEGHGYVSHLTVKENSFDSIDSELDPVTLQFRISHTIIIEPNVQPENENGNGSASGDDNAIRTFE